MNLLKKSIKPLILIIIAIAIPAIFLNALNIYAKSKADISNKEITIDSNYIMSYLCLYDGEIEKSVSYYKKIIPYVDKKQFYKEYISMLMLSRKYKELEETLHKAITKFPKEKEFYDDFIDVLIINGHFEKALENMKQYKKIFGDNDDLDKKFAILLMKNKEYKNAIKYFKKILEKEDDNPDIYSYIAKCYMQQDELDKALKYAKKAYKLEKSDMSNAILLASIYEKKKEFKKAIKIYKKMPKNSITLSAIGNDYYLSNNNKQAVNYFKKAYQKSSKTKYAFKIIYILMEDESYDSLIAFVEKNQYKLLKDDQIRLIYGLALTKKNNCSKAIDIFSKIGKNSKFEKEALYNQAICYSKIHKTDKALSLLEKKAKTMPEIYYLIADLYVKNNKFQKAIEIIKKHKNRLKNKDGLYFYIADIYYSKIHNRKKAIDYLKKSLKINPKNSTCLNYLGYLYIDENINIDKGIELVKKALIEKPDSPYYLDSLGWGYFKKGQYKKALKFIKRAYNEKDNDIYEDDDFTIELHLAKVYLKLKNDRKAKGILDNILRKSKNNKEAKKLLESIR
jgi:tetratricopeptide (TPR) repeat protein